MAQIVLAADFVEYIRNETGVVDAAQVAQAQNAAEGIVKQFCGRSFALTAAVATARVYGPRATRDFRHVLRVHDFTDTASLILNNFGSVISDSTQWQLEPLNGLDDAENVVPYQQIRLLYQPWLPYGMKATSTITAKWGWTAVPPTVYESIKLLGKDWIQHRDNKFGYAETSVGAARVGRNWTVFNALTPFRRVEAFGF